ncbi:MAG: hypothetical protein K0R26_2082 [Bacteroidota bacterium]|jgi:hypothetical protein|nr:hypothetical protein [Bacteroidota bacterium]
MKTLKNIVLITLFMVGSVVTGFAQRGRGNGNGHGHQPHSGIKRNKVMAQPNHARPHPRAVVRSPYRPAKIVGFHPHWHPHHTYHRRWVYFPRYNFYWDNWRQGYYYMNGPVWVFNATPPPVIVNVDLGKEKKHELKEIEDDVDDVYRTNSSHKKEFKDENEK